MRWLSWPRRVSSIVVGWREVEMQYRSCADGIGWLFPVPAPPCRCDCSSVVLHPRACQDVRLTASPPEEPLMLMNSLLVGMPCDLNRAHTHAPGLIPCTIPPGNCPKHTLRAFFCPSSSGRYMPKILTPCELQTPCPEPDTFDYGCGKPPISGQVPYNQITREPRLEASLADPG